MTKKYEFHVPFRVKAESKQEAHSKLDSVLRYGLVETASTTPPKGVKVLRGIKLTRISVKEEKSS